MKPGSLKLKLLLLGVCAVVVTSVVTVGYAVYLFRAEIDVLYARDYGERIRLMEHKYRDLNADLRGIPDAEQSQAALLQRLDDRFAAGPDQRGQPFVFNGDREVLLFPQRDGISAALLLHEAFDQIAGRAEGHADIRLSGSPYRVVFSHYQPWDWYSGYLVADRVRYQGLHRFARTVAVLTALLLLLLALFGARLLSRMLRPFGAITAAVWRLLDGDTEQELALVGSAEALNMARGFNQLGARLRENLALVGQACERNNRVQGRLGGQTRQAIARLRSVAGGTSSMKDTVLQLNGKIEHSSLAVQRIGTQVQQLNRSIDEQASAVTESTAAVEQMSASLDNVASITASKKQSSIDLTRRAQAGGEQLGEMQDAIKAVAGSVDDIAGFVDIIRTMASQTNLLSMNAAIEAAHAGEAGKGFAVVADEIRKLAAEAGESSNSIGRVINAIIERIQTAEALSNQTTAVFEAIDKEVHAVSDSFQEIAATTDQLAAGSSEIRKAMDMLNQISLTVRQGSGESIDVSRQIVESMRSVIEVSAQMISEISAIDTEAGKGSAELEQISMSVAELSQGVGDLRLALRRFGIEPQAELSQQSEPARPDDDGEDMAEFEDGESSGRLED